MRILPVVLLGVPGCVGFCTDLYAPGIVTVNLDALDWAEGRYAIALQGYNEHALCVVDLPAPWTDPDPSLDMGPLTTEPTLQPLVDCTSNLTIELSADGTSIVAVYALDFAPASFQVTVRRDGETLTEQSFTPDYDVTEPNGEGCGTSSDATVSVGW